MKRDIGRFCAGVNTIPPPPLIDFVTVGCRWLRWNSDQIIGCGDGGRCIAVLNQHDDIMRVMHVSTRPKMKYQCSILRKLSDKKQVTYVLIKVTERTSHTHVTEAYRNMSLSLKAKCWWKLIWKHQTNFQSTKRNSSYRWQEAKSAVKIRN